MLDKDKYYTSVHLNHCMLLFMNRLARMFKFIEVQIEAENKWIKTHLDDIYYNEVYLFSDEYVEQWAERAEAEAEYYAEHPEAFEDMEESEEDRLFEKKCFGNKVLFRTLLRVFYIYVCNWDGRG